MYMPWLVGVIANVSRVFQDMITLCERTCPDEIRHLLGND